MKKRRKQLVVIVAVFAFLLCVGLVLFTWNRQENVDDKQNVTEEKLEEQADDDSGEKSESKEQSSLQEQGTVQDQRTEQDQEGVADKQDAETDTWELPTVTVEEQPTDQVTDDDAVGEPEEKPGREPEENSGVTQDFLELPFVPAEK